jgi:DNA polymerase
MLIGEGPGFHEDRQGRPFVGASGQYLEKPFRISDCELRILGSYDLPSEFRNPKSEFRNLTLGSYDLPSEFRNPNSEFRNLTLGSYDLPSEFRNPKSEFRNLTLGSYDLPSEFRNPKSEFRNLTLGSYDLPSEFRNLKAAALRNPAWREVMAKDMRRIPQLLAELDAQRTPRPSQPAAEEGAEFEQLSLF